MAKFFKVAPVEFSYKDLTEKYPGTTEEERGLNGVCPDKPDGVHYWLLYPAWSKIVIEGGKQYCFCVNCGEKSHL